MVRDARRLAEGGSHREREFASLEKDIFECFLEKWEPVFRSNESHAKKSPGRLCRGFLHLKAQGHANPGGPKHRFANGTAVDADPSKALQEGRQKQRSSPSTWARLRLRTFSCIAGAYM